MSELEAPEIGVSLVSVSKVYEPETPIIRDFSAEIPLKQSVAVVGASGSGKSTLLHVIAGLVRPDRGEVKILGRACRTQSEWDRARSRSIGYVFQESFLISTMSVLDNLEMPMIGVEPSAQCRRDKVMSLLTRLGLEGKAKDSTSKLSGGERQRVAVARAVVNSPSIIIADEPTGNLDAVNTRRVTNLLHEVREEFGAVLVIATHDMSVAGTCQRQFLFSDGNIEDRGS